MTYRVTITFSRCGGPERTFAADVEAEHINDAIVAAEDRLYEHHSDAAEIEILGVREAIPVALEIAEEA